MITCKAIGVIRADTASYLSIADDDGEFLIEVYSKYSKGLSKLDSFM